ncbi:MAG: acyl-CoA dehydrogenase [Actinomycetota bacterium]
MALVLPASNFGDMSEFSLHLSDDQLQIKDWIHEFAKDVMRPAAQEWDDREEFPWPVVQEAAKIGLYGIDFMMSAMGDKSGLTLPVAIEEIFWGDAGLGMAIMGSGLAAAGITGNGTPEQIMEWVPQCYGTADDVKLGAFCVSEPDAGSDVSSLRTRAVYDEATDEWVLNGTKAWITNGGIADVHVIVAAVDPALKGRGQASFVVPPGTKGLSQGQKYKKHGIKASHTAEVVLDDVRIPGRCLLGGKEKLDAKLARAREAGRTGEGQPAMKTFEATRPAVGAQALGIARAAYEIALDYAKERTAFGKPIIMNQAIAFKLANMITQIDAARLLIWRAAWLARNGGFTNAEGSMSKFYASEMSVKVTEEAIQILGGYGYTREYDVERMHRDAKIHTIFEGTSEIQQLVIARAISGLRVE